MNTKCTKLNRNNYENEIRYFCEKYYYLPRECFTIIPNFVSFFTFYIHIAQPLRQAPRLINCGKVNKRKKKEHILYSPLSHYNRNPCKNVSNKAKIEESAPETEGDGIQKKKGGKFHCQLNYVARFDCGLISTFPTTFNQRANEAIIKRLTNNEQCLSFKFAPCDVPSHILSAK